MFEIKGKNTRLIYLPMVFSNQKFSDLFLGRVDRELLEEMIPCAEYFSSFMTEVTIM